MLEELHDTLGVEVGIADVIADLHAVVPVGQAAVKFGARRVRILQRDLTEREQPLGRLRRDVEGEVVEDPGDRNGLLSRATVSEEDGSRRDDLHVDAVLVHVGESLVGVPARIGDASELLVAQHDGGLAGRVHAK
jgi:hypothetical protein